MPSTDHRPPDDVEPDPIAGALQSLPVLAPLDDWTGVISRRRRAHRHRQLATAGAVVAALVVVAGLAAAVLRSDDGGLSVQAGEPTTTLTSPSVDLSTVTWTPTAEDPRLVVVIDALPPGPDPAPAEYGGLTDGQVVDLTGPAELFDPNDRPLQCVVVDGRESCDPLPARGSAVLGSPELDGDRARVSVRIRRWILAPSGWQDCRDPLVTCRLVQHGQDGANRATAPLAFATVPDGDGPAMADAGPASDDAGPPQVDVGDGGLVAEGGPTPIDLTDPASRVRRPGTWLQREVTLCRFLPEPTVPGWSITAADCQDQGALPVALDTVADRGLPRTMYGMAGWHDCADGTCFVRVSWGITDPTAPLPLMLYDPAIGAGPVRFDPGVPEQPRPILALEPPGPYRDGELVTVTGTGFPSGREITLGQCHASTVNGTNPWGQPWEDCRYAGPMSIPVDADGGFTVEIPAIRQHLVLGVPGSGVDCALEPEGTCYLGYTRGKGYAEPLASVPLTFTP